MKCGTSKLAFVFIFIALLSKVNSLYAVIGVLSGCVLVFLMVSVVSILVCLLKRQKSEGKVDFA